jgi:hypothetical protein
VSNVACPSCGADAGDAAFCPQCGTAVRRGPAARPEATGSYGPAAWEKLDRSTRASQDLKLGSRATYDRVLRPIGRALTGGYQQRHVAERPPDEFDAPQEPSQEEVERRLGLAVVVGAVLVAAVAVLVIVLLS